MKQNAQPCFDRKERGRFQVVGPGAAQTALS